jgi:cytochrome P450
MRLLSARAFFRDPVGYVRERGENGAVLRLAGPGRSLLVRDPEAVWRVLVTDADSFRQGKWKRRARRFVGDTLNTLDGEEHRRRRALLQPVLDRWRIASFTPQIAARLESAQSGWQDGARIELRTELERLSLTIAGEVLLGADLENDAARLADALTVVMRSVPRLTPPLRGTRHKRALATIHDTLDAMLADRQPSGDDLLSTLLRSDLPAGTIRGELIAFMLAAVDEPPSALEAAWFLLGRNSDAERGFHAELDAKAGTAYLDAVIAETLRLFPPARHIDRCPVEDVRIDGTRVRAGSNVLVSPLVTHHDDRHYDDALEFRPERWLDSDERPKAAYLPFGAGAHTCIGEPLARSIMTHALAGIGRRWHVGVDPAAPPPGPRSPKLSVTLTRR